MCDHPAVPIHRDPRIRRAAPLRVIAVAASVLAVVASGCGALGNAASPTPTLQPYSPGPSATPEPAAEVYARIEQQVQQIRGLTALAPVDPKVLSTADLATELRSRFDKDNPPALIAGEQKLYQALGLLPAGASLKDLLLSMLTSQVAGFYRPDTKQMYVVSETGGLGPTEQVSFAHEYDHALQDQHFDLTKLGTDVTDQGDRSLARLSLAEGDATLLMSDWAQQGLTPLQTLQLLQGSTNPAQAAVLASMPQVLKDDLLFPYTSGLAFVEGIQTSGGWPAVDAVYAKPPDSTEQILHSQKYLDHEEPIAVSFPADLASRLGSGWKVSLQDTFGEFLLREWLEIAGGVPANAASDAAGGWGGDRVALVEGPNGAWGVAIVTQWDTKADADGFQSAATTAAAKLPHSDVFRPSDTKVPVIVGSDDAIRAHLANVLGFAG